MDRARGAHPARLLARGRDRGRRRARRAAPVADAARAPPQAARGGSADVVVVGAGFAGLTAARELAQRRPLGRRARGAQPRRRPRAQQARLGGGEHSERGGTFVGPDPGPHPRARQGDGRRHVPRPTTHGDNVYFADGDAHRRTATPARPAPRRPTRRSCPDLADRGHPARRDVEGRAGGRAVGGAERGRLGLADAPAVDRREQREPALPARSCPLATRPIFGAEPRELSLLFTLFYIASSGNEQNLGHVRAQLQHPRRRADVPLRGRLAADRAAAGAAARPRVVLGTPVRRIEQIRGGVRGVVRQHHVSRPSGRSSRSRRRWRGRIDYAPGAAVQRDQLTQRDAAGHAD